MAGIVVTLGVSIPTGAFFGWITSKLPMPKTQFDDKENFAHCTYGDDCSQFNEVELKATAQTPDFGRMETIEALTKNDTERKLNRI